MTCSLATIAQGELNWSKIGQKLSGWYHRGHSITVPSSSGQSGNDVPWPRSSSYAPTSTSLLLTGAQHIGAYG